MTPLLVLTAVLLLGSGLVKLRAVERVGLGLAVLPLVEVVAGLALAVLPIVSQPTPRGGMAAVVGALGLLLLSSLQVGSAIRARGRRRELSEGARLRTYVQYLSSSPDPDASNPPALGGERE